MITYRPQIAAAIIIIAIFGTAIVLAMVEAADRRANLHLCPLCEQEVQP